MLVEDAWAQYKGPRLQPVVPAKPAPVAPRGLDGPIETRFAAQETKISQLQQELQKMQQDQQQALTQQGLRMDAMEQRQTEHMQTMGSNLDQVRRDLDQALQQSVHQQAQQLDTKFNEIKALLISNKRAAPEPSAHNMQTD